MDYRNLGQTGVVVSRYCLGAMMFGTMGNTDHEDCARIIHRALDAGVNFIDTADAYSRGESEAIVAKALKGRRDDVVVATCTSCRHQLHDLASVEAVHPLVLLRSLLEER